MKKIILSIFVSSILPYAAFAADQVISLKDGSSIKGELVGVSPGFYTIHTQSMGDVKIETSKIANIADASLASSMPAPNSASSYPSASSGDVNQKIDSAQAKIMNSPAAMAAIKDMMADPELSQLLTDPSIAQAAMAHDTEAIKNNPKTKALLDNPKFKAFVKQMAANN